MKPLNFTGPTLIPRLGFPVTFCRCAKSNQKSSPADALYFTKLKIGNLRTRCAQTLKFLSDFFTKFKNDFFQKGLWALCLNLINAFHLSHIGFNKKTFKLSSITTHTKASTNTLIPLKEKECNFLSEMSG